MVNGLDDGQKKRTRAWINFLLLITAKVLNELKNNRNLGLFRFSGL